MNDSILPTLRFCKVCQCETERYKCGKCKPCSQRRGKAWRTENPERISELSVAWRIKNADKKRATDREWARSNPEKRKATHAAWVKSNPNRQKEMDKKRRLDHPEMIKAWLKKWREKNPESIRIHHQNRRARKKELDGKLSPGLSKLLYKLQKGRCACCGKILGEDYHLDHVMPLALGGMHADENMQLLLSTCNQQKHAKHPIDFMQSRGFLL